MSYQESRHKSPPENSTSSQSSSASAPPHSRSDPSIPTNNYKRPSFPNSETGKKFADFYEESDPFFSNSAKSGRFKNRFANRPRLSERLFGSSPNNFPGKGFGAGSIFDKPDGFFGDLKKELEKGTKMFFDNSDTFGFPTSASAAGSASPRSARAGFPFDDIRSSSARSRLDDLAARHPMFASMRNQNPWQDVGDNMGRWEQRARNNSGGAGSTCSSGAASGSSTASCGEEHVIPIRIVHENSSSAADNTANGSSPGNNASRPSEAGTPPEPPKRKQHPFGQHRSATDSSWKPNVGDASATSGTDRSQRAQSAPPNGVGETLGNSSHPQGTQLGGSSSKGKQPSGNQNQSSGSGIRHIPIFVEGRQGPVLPKEPSVDSQNARSPQQSQNSNCSPQKPSRPAEHSPTPPPKKPTPPKDPIEKVQAVSEDVKELEVKVRELKTDRKDKDYVYLDEMLTRNLIKLDDIETEGRDDVRTARKDCIKLIQSCIAMLEAKIGVPVENGETQMEVEGDSMALVPVPMEKSSSESQIEAAANEPVQIVQNSENGSSQEPISEIKQN